MRPCKVFLDSCDPQETAEAVKIFGHIDGQTTNPTLLKKHPDIASYIAQGKKLSNGELLRLYAEAIRTIITYTEGPVSVEVYADWDTSSKSMVAQAEQMQSWGKNIYVKFPTIPAGLQAGHIFAQSGGNVNMTLVFDQSQGAAVYVATHAVHSGVLVSPFVGRWDDRGYNGLDVIQNLRSMFDRFDQARNTSLCHVKILAASMRTVEHVTGAIARGADMVTIPLGLLRQWANQKNATPDELHKKSESVLQSIPYQEIPLYTHYTEYVIDSSPHGLLYEGLQKFASDWKSVVTADMVAY